MPKPPDKRKGQLTNKYFHFLATPLRLVTRTDPAAQENHSKTQPENSLSGGRRSTDADYIDLIDGWYSLSPQERRVTQLTCQGYTNDQIAYKLGVTSGTVNIYNQRIFLKMRVRSKVDLRMKFYGFNFDKYTDN